MRVSNVEFFSKDYTYITHAVTAEMRYVKDYLGVQKNSVTIPSDDFADGFNTDNIFYVKITAKIDIVGVVCGVNANKNSYTVFFKDLNTLFDTNVRVDTDDQGKGALEDFIKKHIEENYLNNIDKLQNIPGLRVETLTSTTDWGFNFKSDVKGMHSVVTNLYENIIVRSFKKYDVVLTPTINFARKTLLVAIERNNAPQLWVESDLGDVITKKFSVNQNEGMANKLVMYDMQKENDVITYYLHADKTFSTQNRDRITPVVPEVLGLQVIENFEKEARSQAYDTFRSNVYNHFIELEFVDRDVNKIKLGQKVKIVKGNKIFETILTGWEIDNTVKIRFGNARFKLSKILERRLSE